MERPLNGAISMYARDVYAYMYEQRRDVVLEFVDSETPFQKEGARKLAVARESRRLSWPGGAAAGLALL